MRSDDVAVVSSAGGCVEAVTVIADRSSGSGGPQVPRHGLPETVRGVTAVSLASPDQKIPRRLDSGGTAVTHGVPVQPRSGSLVREAKNWSGVTCFTFGKSGSRSAVPLKEERRDHDRATTLIRLP